LHIEIVIIIVVINSLQLYICSAGYEVVGVDVSESYVEALNDKTFSSKEPSVNEFLKSSKDLFATTDLKYAADNCKYLYIMVDTPSTGGDRHYDVRQDLKVSEHNEPLKYNIFVTSKLKFLFLLNFVANLGVF
jgi:UDP-glucose 6-dehydrogenase